MGLVAFGVDRAAVAPHQQEVVDDVVRDVVPVRISLVPIVPPLTAEPFDVQLCLIPAASDRSVGSGS